MDEPARETIQHASWFQRSRWGILTTVIALILGLGALGGLARSKDRQIDNLTRQRNNALAQIHNRESQRSADEARVAAAKADQDRASAQAQQAAQAQAIAAAAAAAKRDRITTDGTFAVGIDVNPGSWKTDGGLRCYYAILRSTDTSDIASNNLPGGPTRVTLSVGAFFQTKGCGIWTRDA